MLITKDKLRRLDQRADALGAQRLLHLAALLIHGHLLQIGQELAVGGVLREGAVVTESGRLSTVSAFSHGWCDPFLHNSVTIKRRILPQFRSVLKKTGLDRKSVV